MIAFVKEGFRESFSALETSLSQYLHGEKPSAVRNSRAEHTPEPEHTAEPGMGQGRVRITGPCSLSTGGLFAARESRVVRKHALRGKVPVSGNKSLPSAARRTAPGAGQEGRQAHRQPPPVTPSLGSELGIQAFGAGNLHSTNTQETQVPPTSRQSRLSRGPA